MGHGENNQMLDSVHAVNSSRQCFSVSVLNTYNNGKTVAALAENHFQIHSQTGI